MRRTPYFVRKKARLSQPGASSRIFLMSAKRASREIRREEKESEETKSSEREHTSAEIVALLRLLTREPPPGHDFATCPICKRYGITKI
jgi:hypothetical protein